MKRNLLHHFKKARWPESGSRSGKPGLAGSRRQSVALFPPSESLTLGSALSDTLGSSRLLSAVLGSSSRLPSFVAPHRLMSTVRSSRCPMSQQTADPALSRSSSSLSGDLFTEANCVDLEDQQVKPFWSIPGPRGLCNIPYIGTPLLFSKYPPEKLDKLWAELHETHGPILRVRLGGDWLVILEDLDDVEKMLRPRDPTPWRKPVQPDYTYHKRENSLRVHTLGSTNGEEWRRLRSPLNARMNRPASSLHYLSVQQKVAADLSHRLYQLQDSPPAILQDLIFRYAAESMGVVCFNKRIGFLATDADPATQEQTEKLLQCYRTTIRSIGLATFGKEWRFLFCRDAFYGNYKEAKDYSLKFAFMLMEEELEKLERKQREGTLDPDEPNFLLSLLSEKSLTFEEIVLMCDGLLMAGSDSTACSLQLMFYALATNPDKQEKLAAEIIGKLGPDGNLTPDVLARMPYLKAAVKESIRLYFPIPTGMTRTLPVDITLSGYHIPKGTSIQVSSNRIAKSPRYFDQPHRYLPERWLRGEGGQRERTIPSLAFLPFSIGARNCLGRRFAEQEMYLAATKVLQKYHVGLRDNYGELDTTFTPFCAPDRPLPLTFTARQ